MSTRRTPLEGHVVLVVGAADRTAQRLAGELSARGAAIVAAAPSPAAPLVLVGLIAASGGRARVIDAPSPPLLGEAILRAAAAALAPVTGAVVAESAFASADAARTAADELRRVLPTGGHVVVVEAAPGDGTKPTASRLAAAWPPPPPA